MTVKLALPTGDARPAIGALLARAGIAAGAYEAGSRVVRSHNPGEGLTVRVFREKDIPIQVAMGNYALGICGDVWVSELGVRFPQQHVTRMGALPGPRIEVWLAAAAESGLPEGQVPGGPGTAGVRVASELPNLADLVSVHLRLPAYHLLNVYGSGDAYPPEDADLVVLPAANADEVRAKGLVPLHRVFAGGMALIANSDAVGAPALVDIMRRFATVLAEGEPLLTLPTGDPGAALARAGRDAGSLRLAVPDGHAQRYTPGILRAAGLALDGYDEQSFVRRPRCAVPGVTVKVVRPQDMPQLVAMGMFDLAISGRDLLHEHLCQFPGSPVRMAADLGQNRYRIGPVVSVDFPANSTAEAVPLWNALGRPVRIASEFPATAERFARDLHLRHTMIIPVAGASEGFVPEDADLLVEGTETGTSIRANGLKMLDPFMESTNCVLVRTEPVTTRTDLLESVVARLRAVTTAVGA